MRSIQRARNVPYILYDWVDCIIGYKTTIIIRKYIYIYILRIFCEIPSIKAPRIIAGVHHMSNVSEDTFCCRINDP